MIIWLKRIGVPVMLLALAAAVSFAADPPEPERCSICGFIKSHAPCLVNLDTGEVGELTLYDPHPKLVGELAEYQSGEALVFFYAAGCRATKTTDPWELTIDIPVNEKTIRKSYFCRKCREMLKGQNTGYVLMDLYKKDCPVLYRIYDGARYQIRCYSISVEEKYVSEKYRVRITGTLE